MTSGSSLGKRKRSSETHPYLWGNFAPIQQTCPLTECSFTGKIPADLAGGQYVRNGSNPVTNSDLGREAHWFDGDGMLSGVFFAKQDECGSSAELLPKFVNQYILTDLYLSATATPALRKPIVPSIATLVNPLSSLFRIILVIFRTIFLVILSRLPGSAKTIKKISVANTSVMYHDGRALATCESGPPLRIALPSLDTVGWFDGTRAEGEPFNDQKYTPLGGRGLFSFMKEWTTAHPKVDPETNEMIMFHSGFFPPYVHYSIIPASKSDSEALSTGPKLLNKPVSGISSPKMMHDFGVSKQHTVIMDLPLTLDPLNLTRNKPPIIYDSSLESRFGVFPRDTPSQVRWFPTTACCIFHTVNTWDVCNAITGTLESVDMLACRMTSAAIVFNAGNVVAPSSRENTIDDVFKSMAHRLPEHYAYEKGPTIESNEQLPLLSAKPQPLHTNSHQNNVPYEDDQCRLYYYSFSMSTKSANKITHQYALSTIPFEFPSVAPGREMSFARFAYGCTTTQGTFNSSLGNNSKIDALVKFDVEKLISRAKKHPPTSITGCVDNRSVKEIIMAEEAHDRDIQIFQTPAYHYAQEPRFAPSLSESSEDDGYLLAYIFDESQLSSDGQPPPSATSELWIIDAKGMKDVLAKICLPQRVPYGLHGNWFAESQILCQRPIDHVRMETPEEETQNTRTRRMGKKLVHGLIKAIGG